MITFITDTFSLHVMVCVFDLYVCFFSVLFVRWSYGMLRAPELGMCVSFEKTLFSHLDRNIGIEFENRKQLTNAFTNIM